MKSLGNVVIALISMLAFAFTFMTLWGWFIVPLGVKAITMAHAFGLSLVVGALKPKNKTEDNKYTFAERCMGSIGVNLILLGMGYLTVFFM
jgi:hypothetical protein